MKMNNMKRKIAAMLTIIALMSVSSALLTSACAARAKNTLRSTTEEQNPDSSTAKLKTLNSPYVVSTSTENTQSEED